MSENCFFCNSQSDIQKVQGMDAWEYDCANCGRYRVTGPSLASNLLQNISPEDKAGIAAVLSERIDKSQPIAISGTNKIQELLDRFPKRVDEKLNKALLNLSKFYHYLGEVITVDSSYPPILYALNRQEYEAILSALCDTGYITCSAPSIDGAKFDVTITPKGYERIYELGKVNPDSPQAFVAMWFPDPVKNKTDYDALEKAYDNGFKKAIKEAGYDDRRIDRQEFIGKIDDEIIAEIKRSRFLVADFTGQRGGVYYEAGFAHGLGIPVIYTCREDDKEKRHFDTRQYKHIFWKDEGDLYSRLLHSIRANI